MPGEPDDEIEITPEMREVAELALLGFSREHSLLEDDAEKLVRELIALYRQSEL